MGAMAASLWGAAGGGAGAFEEPDLKRTFPGKKWDTPPPELLGLDGARLDDFAARVGGDGCIVQSGYLVRAWGNIALHKDWASAAKPVLSTLLLLAVGEGRLASVDARVSSVGWALAEKDREMTFRHLADMVSGYACGEAPGAAWGYNDFAIQLYARSLEKVFEEPLDTAFRRRMAPLQLEDGLFFGSREGRGVNATPRDFARLGWLWLNQGRWRNRSVLPRRLFRQWVQPGVPRGLPRTTTKGEDYLRLGTYGGGTDQTPHGPGVYGFNFWFNEAAAEGESRVWPSLPADAYQANGMWNRDTVTVVPSLDLVVAVRGAHPGKFEPGLAGSEFDRSMKLLVEAVR
jgi:CubicO group peptidase (beta-lactamase class C family)